MLEGIKSAWGWAIPDPEEVLEVNSFGNVLVWASGQVWRVSPEELSCEVVAGSKAELEELRKDEEFVEDWEMENLVETAVEALGPLAEGQSYCLKIPGVLGGEYGASNLGKISTKELIAASGDFAQQISGLPDGAQVQFRFVP